MPTVTKVIAECERDSSERYKFYYRLSASKTHYEGKIYPSFLVYVSVKGEGFDYFDETEIQDLTSCESTALRFFDLISNGLVTPLTLRDVAEDFLADL